jgi:hypothetical protein
MSFTSKLTVAQATPDDIIHSMYDEDLIVNEWNMIIKEQIEVYKSTYLSESVSSIIRALVLLHGNDCERYKSANFCRSAGNVLEALAKYSLISEGHGNLSEYQEFALIVASHLEWMDSEGYIYINVRLLSRMLNFSDVPIGNESNKIAIEKLKTIIFQDDQSDQSDESDQEEQSYKSEPKRLLVKLGWVPETVKEKTVWDSIDDYEEDEDEDEEDEDEDDEMSD